MRRFPVSVPVICTVAALGLAGCEKPQVKTYRVERPITPEPSATPGASAAPDAAFARPATAPVSASPSPTPAPARPPASMPGGLSAAPAVHPVHWSAPADWEAQPERPMRRATYLIPSAGAKVELAVTSFPGDVGGLAANINRWRTQLSLPSQTPEEVVAAAEKLTVAGQQAYLVNFAGSGSGQMSMGGAPAPAPAAEGVLNRTLGLILPFPEETWFFKLGGPDAAVAAQEPVFREFIQTIHGSDEHTEAAHATAPAVPDAAAHQAAPLAHSGVPADAGPQLAIQVPPGWTASAEKRAFRLATINIPGGAEIAITALEGPYGSLEENAERWYGELRSPAVQNPTTLKIIPVEAPGSPFNIRVIDLSAPGAAPAEGMLVGIVEKDNFSWFCKLKGPAGIVETQRPIFAEFLSKLTLE
jgi:hypothetical protein